MDTLILNKDGTPLSVVPLSVISWQTAIRLAYQEKVRVHATYENWVVRSPSVEMHVPSVVMTTDYVKWGKQIKYSRSNVYLRDRFTCQLCSKQFPVSQLTLDHVVPRSHGGKTNWTNIITACKPCNHRKGDNHKIRPRVMPSKPNYYEIMAKRMQYPVAVRDESWLPFLAWDKELIQMRPARGAD
jgi:5-methylcytosine-specific restriction endonuclease McrA